MELKQRKGGNATVRRTLLIVPYGIETSRSNKQCKGQRPFNRTLWN